MIWLRKMLKPILQYATRPQVLEKMAHLSIRERVPLLKKEFNKNLLNGHSLPNKALAGVCSLSFPTRVSLASDKILVFYVCRSKSLFSPAAISRYYNTLMLFSPNFITKLLIVRYEGSLSRSALDVYSHRSKKPRDLLITGQRVRIGIKTLHESVSCDLPT